MGAITKKGTIEFSISIKEFIARAMSKWSLEFSVFMGLVITLYEMELVDIILLKIFLTIALVGFFLAVMLKFGIAVYKDSAHGIIEISNCIKKSKESKPEPEPEKTPENHVKEAVKVIEENIPLIDPDYVIPTDNAEPDITNAEPEPKYLPGTEPDDYVEGD